MLQRVLQLPVVSSTCESLQRTYSSTKEIHPVVASVCEVYEQGVKGASALAMWSVEPVVRRLEPQCESIRRGVTGQPTVGHHSRSPLAQPLALISTPHAFAQGSLHGQQFGMSGLGPPGGEDPSPSVSC